MSAARTPARTSRRTAPAAPDTGTGTEPTAPVPAAPADTAPDTAPVPAAGTVPAYAAGSGLPGLVLDAACGAGFRCEPDQDGNVRAVSPDGRLTIDFGPESNHYALSPMGGLWLVTYVDEQAPRNGWFAKFGDNCPAEAITAFVKALNIEGGLDPERVDAPGRAQITVQITTTATSPVAAEEQADNAQATAADK